MILFLFGLVGVLFWFYYSINPLGVEFTLRWFDSIMYQIHEPRVFIPALTIVIICSLLNLFLLIRRKTDYGYARIGTLRDAKKRKELLNFKGRGLILGKIKNKFLYFESYLSLMCFAPPGTGKTAGIVIPNLLHITDRSIVANDPKGELLETTSKFRASFSKILVFDPLMKLSIPDENRATYNILETKKNEDFIVFYQKLSRAGELFFFLSESRKEDPHWNNRAKSFFMLLGLYLFNEIEKEKISLPKILDTLTKIRSGEIKVKSNDPFDNEESGDAKLTKTFIINYMKQLVEKKEMVDDDDEKEKYDYIIQSFSEFSESEEKEFDSVMSSFTSKLSFCYNPLIKKSLLKTNFSAENLRSKLITVYIIITQEDRNVLSPVLNAISEDLTKALFSKMPKKEEQGVLFLFDEVAMMGKLKQVIEAPALSRGYKFHYWFIAQSINQLYSIYNQDLTKAFLGTIGVQYVLTQNSNEDAKTISEYAGDFTRTAESGSKKGFARMMTKAAKDDISVKEEGYKLITSQDVRALDIGWAYVFMQKYFHIPLKIKTPFWEKNKKLKARKGNLFA